MLSIRLESVHRYKNAEKFYEIILESDMFANWTMTTIWDRIGAEGRPLIQSYPDRAKAIKAARLQCRRKLGRGYTIIRGDAELIPPTKPRAEDKQTRLLRCANELDHLLQSNQQTQNSRFGRIAASLASAARLRPPQTDPAYPAGQSRAAFLLDDTNARIRARVFQLLDELVSGVLTEDDEHAVIRTIQENSGSGVADGTVRMIPRTKFNLLNARAADIFAGHRQLADFTLDALDHNIRYLGELVQLDEEQVLRIAKGNRAILRHLTDELHQRGLSLGARAPGWRPPGFKRAAGL